ncbi:calpain small subunit 1-like [Entelurus aequoreus]|uniref:calpain small subunit 1-like n=1 Tax=Entelurus aequoreus TaxID=161455 RepID=UPI002B1E0F8C|nr:calpain small subunit 1-like [Entelurus aequoreus]
MLAAIQHHSTGARAGGGGGGGGGDGGGSSGGGGGGETAVPLGSSRFSISTTTAGSASMSTRAPEGPPMHSRSLDNSASDPNYIWQTVDDIRKFAEVLLHLKEAFNFAGLQRSCVGNPAGVLLGICAAMLGVSRQDMLGVSRQDGSSSEVGPWNLG